MWLTLGSGFWHADTVASSASRKRAACHPIPHFSVSRTSLRWHSSEGRKDDERLSSNAQYCGLGARRLLERLHRCTHVHANKNIDNAAWLGRLVHVSRLCKYNTSLVFFPNSNAAASKIQIQFLEFHILVRSLTSNVGFRHHLYSPRDCRHHLWIRSTHHGYQRPRGPSQRSNVRAAGANYIDSECFLHKDVDYPIPHAHHGPYCDVGPQSPCLRSACDSSPGLICMLGSHDLLLLASGEELAAVPARLLYGPAGT